MASSNNEYSTIDILSAMDSDMIPGELPCKPSIDLNVENKLPDIIDNHSSLLDDPDDDNTLDTPEMDSDKPTELDTPESISIEMDGAEMYADSKSESETESKVFAEGNGKDDRTVSSNDTAVDITNEIETNKCVDKRVNVKIEEPNDIIMNVKIEEPNDVRVKVKIEVLSNEELNSKRNEPSDKRLKSIKVEAPCLDETVVVKSEDIAGHNNQVSDTKPPLNAAVSGERSADDGPGPSETAQDSKLDISIEEGECSTSDDSEYSSLSDISSGDDINCERCPICLMRLSGGQSLGNPECCDHSFCLECLEEWSKKVNTCPVDRLTFGIIFERLTIGGDIVHRIDVADVNQQQEEEEQQLEEEELTYCEVCQLANREDCLLLCDGCDSGYHYDCLTPPLDRVPLGDWFCMNCRSRANVDDSGIQIVELPASTSTTTIHHTIVVPRTLQSVRVRAAIQRVRLSRIVSDSDSAEVDLFPGEDLSIKYPEHLRARPAKKRKIRRKRRVRKSRRGRKRRGAKRLRKPSTVKTRLASLLGITKPRVGQTIPRKTHSESVKDKAIAILRGDLPTENVLCVTANRNTLDPSFSDTDTKVGQLTLSQAAQKYRRPITSSTDVLGDILACQNSLHNSVYDKAKDGSLRSVVVDDKQKFNTISKDKKKKLYRKQASDINSPEQSFPLEKSPDMNNSTSKKVKKEKTSDHHSRKHKKSKHRSRSTSAGRVKKSASSTSRPRTEDYSRTSRSGGGGGGDAGNSHNRSRSRPSRRGEAAEPEENTRHRHRSHHSPTAATTTAAPPCSRRSGGRRSDYDETHRRREQDRRVAARRNSDRWFDQGEGNDDGEGKRTTYQSRNSRYSGGVGGSREEGHHRGRHRSRSGSERSRSPYTNSGSRRRTNSGSRRHRRRRSSSGGGGGHRRYRGTLRDVMKRSRRSSSSSTSSSYSGSSGYSYTSSSSDGSTSSSSDSRRSRRRTCSRRNRRYYSSSSSSSSGSSYSSTSSNSSSDSSDSFRRSRLQYEKRLWNEQRIRIQLSDSIDERQQQNVFKPTMPVAPTSISTVIASRDATPVVDTSSVTVSTSTLLACTLSTGRARGHEVKITGHMLRGLVNYGDTDTEDEEDPEFGRKFAHIYSDVLALAETPTKVADHHAVEDIIVIDSPPDISESKSSKSAIFNEKEYQKYEKPRLEHILPKKGASAVKKPDPLTPLSLQPKASKSNAISQLARPTLAPFTPPVQVAAVSEAPSTSRPAANSPPTSSWKSSRGSPTTTEDGGVTSVESIAVPATSTTTSTTSAAAAAAAAVVLCDAAVAIKSSIDVKVKMLSAGSNPAPVATPTVVSSTPAVVSSTPAVVSSTPAVVSSTVSSEGSRRSNSRDSKASNNSRKLPSSSNSSKSSKKPRLDSAVVPSLEQLEDINDPANRNIRKDRIIEEVKLALKPFYTDKRIDKCDYKDIMRKAVPKIVATNHVNVSKIVKLVVAYVDKIEKVRKHYENKIKK